MARGPEPAAPRRLGVVNRGSGPRAARRREDRGGRRHRRPREPVDPRHCRCSPPATRDGLSVEADLAFLDDPDEAKSDDVDGRIGEGSAFHAEFGYYAQGVTLATAVLPEGWRDRLIAFERADAEPSHARCLEPHDLVVAKLVANREKDP